MAAKSSGQKVEGGLRPQRRQPALPKRRRPSARCCPGVSARAAGGRLRARPRRPGSAPPAALRACGDGAKALELIERQDAGFALLDCASMAERVPQSPQFLKKKKRMSCLSI